MNWTIDFSPFVGWPLFWGVAVLAAMTALLVLWGGVRGRLLRVASLILLVLALANPVLRQEQRRPLSNVLLAIVDQSASQNLAGRAAQVDRLRAALEQRLAAIPNLQVRWMSSSRPGAAGDRGAMTPMGDGTTLFADLERGLSQIPANRLAGVIMLTDGRVHDVPAKPGQLGLKVPLHVFITGRKGERDRRLEVLRAPRYGLVGSTARARLRVRESPSDTALKEGRGKNSGSRPRGRPAEVTIHREGRPPETRLVRIGESFEVDIGFPHAGSNIVEVALKPEKGELTAANNRAVIVAEGVRENLRVLLVSGEPHPGERTWRNLLKSDAAVDLVHFTILRPPRKQDGTPIHQLSLIAFPTRELFSEKLHEFDLIIFDRYKRRGVLPLFYFDNIAQFVRQGGAVLLAAGSSFAGPRSLAQTPLGQILPAEPTGRLIERPYRAQTTPTGRLHPVTRTLPGGAGKNPRWGRWFRLIDADFRRGQTLMQGPDGRPLLVLDRYGKGRVALMLSDHAWLWARGYDGGGPYNTLFRRLAHWLMKEPDLEEESLRAIGQKSHLLIERRTMTDKVGPVEITSPTGVTTVVRLEKVKPGLWRKKVKAPVSGIYRLKGDGRQAAAHVGRLAPREMSVVTATDKLLRPVTRATGGGIFWPPPPAAAAGSQTGRAASASAPPPSLKLPRISMMSGTGRMHGSGWLGLRDRKAHIVQGVSLTPLASGLFALALALALFAAMWYREGH